MGSNKYKRKKILNAFILFFSFLAILTVTSCMGMGPFANRESQTTDQSIETFQVARGNILQEITTTGSVDTKNQNVFSFQVSEKVISALEKGDSFKKGDVLVELDNSDGLLTVKQAEIDLKNIEDNLILSNSSLKTAKINYQSALDANHVAIQLAETNTKKSEEATANALIALENANRSADIAYESASTSLKNATIIANLNVASAESALVEAKRILEYARNHPGSTTPEELAQYEYNVESAEEKYDLAVAQQQSSIDSAESSKESSEVQSNSSADSAQN